MYVLLVCRHGVDNEKADLYYVPDAPRWLLKVHNKDYCGQLLADSDKKLLDEVARAVEDEWSAYRLLDGDRPPERLCNDSYLVSCVAY